jgi:cytochrome c5
MAAEPTSHDPEDHASFIKTPQQLVTIVVLAFVVPVVLIILLAKAVVSMRAPDPAVLAPEAVAMRIKPVAVVAIQPGRDAAAAAKSPAATPSAAAPPVTASPAPAGAAGGATSTADGKAVYDRACIACHQGGVAGAPKFGDKAAWAPRIGGGMEALYASVLKGKGAMPPKGGQTALADAEVKAAVDYMVAAAK